MMQMRRGDNRSVYLTANRNGLARLFVVLQVGDRTDRDGPEVSFDMSVVTMKRNSPTVTTTLAITTGETTELSQVGDCIVWTITDEDRQCVIPRFVQCSEVGAFVRAELLHLRILKNRHLDYLYGELV